MTNPYLTDDGSPELRPSWLCFLDILGFSEILRENDQSRITQLHSLLRNGRGTLAGDGDEAGYLGYHFHALTSFTDNIVLGFPIHDDDDDDGESESGIIFERLAKFQLNMALSGFFVRGGVAVGLAYIDDLAVYGPALLEAHNSESRLASDPRIVLSHSAKELVGQHLGYYEGGEHAPQNFDLKQDRDGQWFIDYLQMTLDFDTSFPPATVDQDKVELHRAVVQENLERFADHPAIWRKYEWVALYHNDFCRRNSESLTEDIFVNVESVRGVITDIIG